MRISDWSSDVCSSDLAYSIPVDARRTYGRVERRCCGWELNPPREWQPSTLEPHHTQHVDDDLARHVDIPAMRSHRSGAWEATDRKSVVEGKSVSVRVALGGSRSIKKKKNIKKK